MTPRVAFITGAGQGIGRAIALRLARDGLDIAVNDVNTDAAAAVADEIRGLGRRAEVAPADVTHRDELVDAVGSAATRLGGLDVMVNNAGIIRIEAIDEIRPEGIGQIMAVNVYGVIWGMQAAVAQFRTSGRGGKVVNACSGAAYRPAALYGSYASTKFAVRALTQVAAQEYGHEGITVNAYAPGVVDTPMWDTIDERLRSYNGLAPGENRRRFAQGASLPRTQQPDDVANLVSFLAGEDSGYITGQTYLVDGGKNFG